MKQILTPIFVSIDTSGSKSGSSHEPSYHVNKNAVFEANRLTELSIENLSKVFERIFQRSTGESEEKSQPFKAIEVIGSNDETKKEIPFPTSTPHNSKSHFIQSVTENSQQGAMKVNINRQSLQDYTNRIDPNNPFCNLTMSDLSTSGGMIHVSVYRNTFLDFMEDQANDPESPMLSILESGSHSIMDDVQLNMNEMPMSTLESNVYQLFHEFLKNSKTNSDTDCSECPV